MPASSYLAVPKLIRLGCVALAAWPGVALAQAQGEVEGRAIALDEVVVTARKREETLQDVPLAVSAFSAESIERLAIANPFDLAALTPGLFYQNVGYRNSDKPSIRGLTTASTLPSQQKVSAFIDGIYVNGVFGTQSLVDLERIEVLKGPQSAFFGRSTFAGAINYITRDPGDEFSARITGQVATLGETTVSALVGGPLVGERLRGQLSVYSHRFRGPSEWRNQPDGTQIGDESTQGLSGKLVLDAADSLRLEMRAAYTEDDDGHLNAIFVPASRRDGQFPRPNGTVGFYPTGTIDTPAPSFRYNLGVFPQPGLERSTFRSSIQADWQLGEYALTGIVAKDEQGLWVNADFDLGPVNTIRLIQDEDYDDESLELRLASPSGSRFRYLLGVYALDLSSNVFNIGGAAPTRAFTEVENRAVFGGAQFDLTEALTLGVDGRYQTDDVRVTNIAGTRFQGEFKKFLPRLTLDWKLNPDVLVYALGSRGNNPGDFNTVAGIPASQVVVREEELTNYEVGLKSYWLDRRLRVNVAAYHMKWKDQQQRRSFTLQINNVPTLFSALFNEGDSTSQGLEVEAAFAPAPEWDIRLGLNYQDATFDSFCSTNLYTLRDARTLAQGGLPSQCLPVDGNELEAQPGISGSLAINWTRPLGEGRSLYVGGDLAYSEGTYESEMNLAKAAAATQLNLRLGFERDDLRVELYGRNLSDEDAPARVARLSDFSLGATAAINQNVAVSFRRPRQVGMRIVYTLR